MAHNSFRPAVAFLAAFCFNLLVHSKKAAAPQVANASPAFNEILGSNPTVSVVFNTSQQLFHEGGIYHPPTDSLFVISEQIKDPAINNNRPSTVVVHVTNVSSSAPQHTLLNIPNLPNPGSGARYLYNNADLIALVAIGNKKGSPPGGVFLFNPYPPFNVTPLTTRFGSGYEYNSPDDATVFPDGSIYFTDPGYGFGNGIRPPAKMPNQVYQWSPSGAGTMRTRAVADQFGRPNGITRSPDGQTLYVCDTGASIGNGTIDNEGQRSIYAFSVKNYTGTAGGSSGGGTFITERRVFAMPDVGAVDGLKTDTQGNVWGFSTDGIHVWNDGGEFLGKILLDFGLAGGNFGFGKPGVMFLMGGNVLYKVTLSESVMGTGVYS